MKLPLIILVYLVTTVAAQTTPSPGCGDTSYYGPSGVITSPNYPGNYYNSLRCNYTIYASTDSLLSITFQAFDVGDEYCSTDCDYVTISCASDPSFPPKIFSGTLIPGDILIFGCTQGLVYFHTGYYTQTTGFHLTYNITEEVPTACGVTIHGGTSGVISSPNYPGNYYDDHSCDYTIYASNGSSFTLTFKSFDVEDGYDFVNVSCATNSSFLPRSYSGRSLPDAISIPWCSKALIKFRTDSSTVSSGFSIDYYVSNGGCGNTAYTGPSGHIQSVNYPNIYPSNQNCSSIIWAPGRNTFYLEFESLFLHSCCTCDWLEIRCVDNSEYGPYKFCGSYTSSESIYIHQCSEVLVVFHSDDSDNEQGFKIQYTVYPDAETTIMTGTPGYTQTTPGSTTKPACVGKHFYGPSGVLTSPNYPGNYSNNLYCNWYIHTSSGSSILFIFQDFHVDFLASLTIECLIAQGQLKMYSGQTLPPPRLLIPCSKARVSFETGSISYMVDSGFYIDYFVSDGGCGPNLYNESSGNVISPNYPSNYSYYQNCSNIIWAPQRSHFHLNFVFFELQDCGLCPADWVEVSCLDNNPSDKHRFCGTSSYPLDFYQCSQVLVWFHSDGSSNNKGFNLEYYVENTTLPGTTNLPQTTQTAPDVSTPIPGCGEFLCGPTGTITSPNYPGNYDDSLKCNYYIQASTGSFITLVFQHFDLQDDKDYIIISCATNSSFPQQQYSGHTLPRSLTIPWCSQGSVYFQADKDTVFSGFSIDYFVNDAGCGNTVYAESIGNITSPNYPGQYDPNRNCYSIIDAPQRSQFHINFRDIYMDPCEMCLCDWVEFSCLDNNPANRYRSCGSAEASFDLYQCTQALVWFHSGVVNSSYGYTGFDLEYNVYPVQDCGEASYYGPSGVINSPENNAGFYPDSLSCDYDIYTTSSEATTAIIYRAFNTEECCDHVTVSCPTNSSYQPVISSGSSPHPPVSVPWCSQARVNFATDSSVISTGFSLDYYISQGGCGNTAYAGSHGYVSSPNHPNDYGVSQNCSNIIWVNKPASYDVTFLHMDLEECCDFVELSCVDNPEYGKHRFTGDSIPPPQYIPECSQILVWFYSDDSNEYAGFNLEYSISPKSANKERHNGGEKLPSDGKPTSGKKVLNKERHNGGEKVLNKERHNGGEKVLNKEKHNAGEKVPGNGKPKPARK